jgi:AraC-like DNA-binding protein
MDIQTIITEIDRCIRQQSDETVTLGTLAQKLGYTESYVSRKFREISGMQFRDYLRLRRLAFALKELRDTSRGILEIAMDYGFSSHEAFTRAFKEAYGLTPGEYRRKHRSISNKQ